MIQIAAFTMAFNEGRFLDFWLNHYGSALGFDNLFVLDHGSVDGSTDNMFGANRIKIPRWDFDEDRRRKLVQGFQSALLNTYDAVIFSDTDELLVPDPHLFYGLKDYVEKSQSAVAQATGLDVLHIPSQEKDLNVHNPLFYQRSFVRFSARYCKPLVARVPLVWRCGFHSCDHPIAIDPHLYLFHLKRMDLKLSLDKLHQTRKWIWSERSLRLDHGYQHRYSDERFIKEMFDFSAEEINGIDRNKFTFEVDIQRYDPFASFEGTIAQVPARFRDTIQLLNTSCDFSRNTTSPGVPHDLGAGEEKMTRSIYEVSYEGKITRFCITNPSDHIQSSLVSGKFYEQRQVVQHLDVIPLDSIVLDIGANVGNHTMFYASHSGARTIYPFEPNPEANIILRQNVELNFSGDNKVNLRYAHLALGSSRSQLRIRHSPHNNLGRTSLENGTASDSPIECVTLDSLSIDRPIGFLKIDVEGMELNVLAGARETIALHRPAIFVEIDRKNEVSFWNWMDEHRYEAVGASFNYPSVKNFLIFPRA